MTYRLHQGAEADLLEAARFYRDEAGLKLAHRFLDEFERVAELLVRFPGLGTAVGGARRSHPMQGFPYSVIYREAEDGIRVLVVHSHHRHPGHGQRRR